MNTYEKIYETVKRVPYGKVATYGQIANLAGLYRKARLVGYALFRVAPDADVPWHRVINAKGEISESPFREGNDYLQRSLLESEGITFNESGRVNFRQCQWQPEEAPEINASSPPSFDRPASHNSPQTNCSD
jgi:methylated-DNA-protein-cysteine methyltransferase related protein